MSAVVRRLAAIAVTFSLCCATSGVWAASPLYAIGADDLGVGRVFTPIVPSGAGVALGDGSTAYNGGLTYLPSDGRFYAIENDALGQSSLTSFLSATPTLQATPTALGSGFYGGLAADPASSRLYAIASDFSGASTLYRVSAASGATALGALGSGFYGGLSFDSQDGQLYAISADDLGVQRRLTRIALASDGTPTATALFDLGDGSLGFQGGLAYDAEQHRFVTIASDSLGNSSLQSFTLGGGAASLTDLGVTLAPGYVNAGLAYVTAVPEPGNALMWAAGLLPMLLWARRRRTRPTAFNHE